MALSGQILPANIESTYLPRTGAVHVPAAELNSSDTLAESFISRSLAAAQIMLEVQLPGR